MIPLDIRTAVLICVLALALGAVPIWAEKPCHDEAMTWGQCLAMLENQKAQADKRISTSTQTFATETQVQNIWSELLGAATTSEVNLEDFLSSLLANIDIDGLESGDDGIRFKKNIQLAWGTLALEVQARQMELFPELAMQLEKLEEKDLQTALEQEIGDFDSVDFNAAFSVDRFGEDQGIWWGRRFQDGDGNPTGNGELANRLFQAIPPPQIETTLEDMDEALNQFRSALALVQTESREQGSGSSLTIGGSEVADRAKLMRAIEDFVQAEEAGVKRFKRNVKDQRYYEFSSLVANQPQFVLDGAYSFRDELVGRDSWSASIKYEVGQANVNGLRRYLKSSCSSSSDILRCFHQYLDLKSRALERNWRISFMGKYNWIDEYDFQSPDGNVTLNLDTSQSWDVRLSAGRSLQLDKEGMEINRIDLEAMYEDVTGDTMKQGRFVSTLTFTQKLNSEGLSFSTSLIYANRPEFRGEVDEELSARAGFKFALKPPKLKSPAE